MRVFDKNSNQVKDKSSAYYQRSSSLFAYFPELTVHPDTAFTSQFVGHAREFAHFL